MWQVTKEVYESCDITRQPIREWFPPLNEGSVVVWLERGETHYLIDPIAGNCLTGSKLKVTTCTQLHLAIAYKPFYCYICYKLEPIVSYFTYDSQ